MTPSEFNEIYSKAKVWADFDPLLEKTDIITLHKLSDALELIKDYTGIDMRQDFLLGNIKGHIKHHRGE